VTNIKQTEVVYEVNEKVADVFGMPESEIIAMEVLDGIIFKAFGSHFLEPQTKTFNDIQVVPSVKDKIRQDTQIRRNTLAK
jgi:hypothetical protein